MISLKFAKTTNGNSYKIEDIKTPTRGTLKSAGIDFYTPKDISMAPNSSVLVDSGLKCLIPEGYCLIAFNKSGVSTKKNCIVGACVIDEDYQGKIHIHLFNLSNEWQYFDMGEKIIQFILVKTDYLVPQEVTEEELFSTDTERRNGGFGSTGIY